MNEHLLKEFKEVLHSGKNILHISKQSKLIYQQFIEENNLYKIIYNDDIRDLYVDRTPYDVFGEYARSGGVFLFYIGSCNSELQPSGKGMMLAVARRDLSEDNLEDDFEEVERFEGEWRDGTLVYGTYSSYASPYTVNPPFVNSALYDFFINGIMFAEENPGKMQVSMNITYTGGFDDERRFHGDSGELILDYKVEWIRKGFDDSGNLIFKGSFDKGSISFGEYKGPYIGYSPVYDKRVKYEGQFFDGLPHGTGKLHYNLEGGYHHHDRISCEYTGEFRKGLRYGSNGIDNLNDSEYGVRIQLLGCVYNIEDFDEPILEEVKEIRITGNDFFGFNPEVINSTEVIYEGALDTTTDLITIPHQISTIMGKGCLRVLTTDYASKLYVNHGEEGVNGTFRYLLGKVLLDGVFTCLDEGTRKLSYEKWSCGYLVDSSDQAIGIKSFNIATIGNKFADEIIDGSKDATKRMLTTILASKAGDGLVSKVGEFNLFLQYLVIGLLAALVKAGKDTVLKKISVTNKVELARTVRSGISAIKGEMKKIDLEIVLVGESNNYLEAVYNFRGGFLLNKFTEEREMDELKLNINNTKKMFMRTDEYFSEMLKILEGDGRRVAEKLGMGVDNLIRDYQHVKQLFTEIDDWNTDLINKEDIILITSRLSLFKEAHLRIYDIVSNALQRIHKQLIDSI